MPCPKIFKRTNRDDADENAEKMLNLTKMIVQPVISAKASLTNEQQF